MLDALQHVFSVLMQQHSMLEQVNKQPAEYGGTNVYISPTGSPDALVILGNIVAAHSRIHVIRGPLIPTNLVSFFKLLQAPFYFTVAPQSVVFLAEVSKQIQFVSTGLRC